jgi:hypothetical protein
MAIRSIRENLGKQGRTHVIANRDYSWDEVQQIMARRGGIGKEKGKGA